MDRLFKKSSRTVGDYGKFSHHLTAPLSLEDLAPDEHDSRTQQSEFDLRQANRQLEQISSAAQRFSIELDRKNLFNEIACQAYEIIRADQIVVYSNFENRLACETQSPNICKLNSRPNENVRWCVRYLKPKIDNQPQNKSIRNSICVPMLTTQNRVLGVIEARNKRTGGFFTQQDLRVANCLARVASSAVDRANLFFRIEEWKQSIETLLSFNATVNQSLEPSEMVVELVKNVTGFLEADGGAAGLVIRQESGVIAVSDSFYFDGQTHEYRREWQPGQGIPGTVLETEFPLLVNNYQTNKLVDRRLVELFDIGSCICVPIKNSHEEVLGFFKLHRRVGEPQFTWQDAAFLESLGNTAAVAIENARLVRSLEFTNEKIKSLSQQHVRQLELERQHISRELHDQSGQLLVGLKLRLQLLSGMLEPHQQSARQELTDLQQQINHATSQLKDLARKLRPPTLDELGFESSLRQLLADFRRQTNISVQIDILAQPQLASEAETALYRIAQECLTNIAKHADATSVNVSFSSDQGFQVLKIRDNGVGFDTDQSHEGLGLIGIRERVKMLNGNLFVDSDEENGTSIIVVLAKGQS